MCIFEGGLGAGVTKQPANGEHGLALSQRDAGMAVPEIVKTDIADARLGADLSPEAIEPVLAAGVVATRRREDPVEALEVEKDTIFWDRELTGFGVRSIPRGERSTSCRPGSAASR